MVIDTESKMEVLQWHNGFDSKLVFIPLISIISLIYCLIKDIVIEDKYQLFYFLDKKEIKKLEEILSDEVISPRQKRLTRDKLNSIAYRYATGIKAETVVQEKIVEYHELAQGRLEFDDFKKALSFLNIDRNGILIVREIKLFDYITQGYWIALTGLIAIFNLYLFSNLIFLPLSVAEQIHWGLILVFNSVIFLIFRSRISILSSVRKIRDEIKNNSLITLHTNNSNIES